MTEHIFNFFTVHFHFNSHPHEEDDLLLHWNIVFFHISTHILTRRMTNKDDTLDTLFNISTHILTRRMTSIGSYFWISAGDFNSHPHEEDDDFSAKMNLLKYSFQLTSSRGGWQSLPAATLWSAIFQLTSSRGGWLTLRPKLCLWCYFNSHPHEEDDMT